MASWRKGSAYLYLEERTPDSRVLVSPYDAEQYICRYCSGLHLLKPSSWWLMCTNEECEGQKTRNPWDTKWSLIRPPYDPDVVASTYALGGPEAVLDFLREHETSIQWRRMYQHG